MAMTDAQKTSLTYKKLLGVAETSTSKQFFEEPFSTGFIVLPNQIWQDAALIPTPAPDISPTSQTLDDGLTYVCGDLGIVRYFLWLSLLPVAGSSNSFHHTQLKNAIPFNFDSDGTYMYRLRNQSNFDIAFGIQDWLIDPIAGVLTFYGNNLSSIGVAPESPPKITFYQYIGRFGVGSGGGGSGVGLPISDAETLLNHASNPLIQAKFGLAGTSGVTTYTLPSISSGTKNGILLVQENLNVTIDEIGIIDSGEYI